MFNLVKYRWVFIIISLLVIVPGLIFLLWPGIGLNVGIDFRGGANISLRPQRAVTSAEMQNLLKPLKFGDLQLVFGNLSTGTSQTANKTVWVRFNTTIDSNVQSTLFNKNDAANPGLILGKYAGTTATFYDIPATKPYTLMVVSGFANAPTVSDIRTLLSKLPNTSDTTKGPATVSATATTATTPTAKGTPSVATTPTTSNPANIPVSVADVSQGSSTQTVTIQTTSNFQTTDVPKLFAAILNGGGPYMSLDSNSEVGPSVASDTRLYSVLAVLAASVLILGYIWFSFRKVAKPWRYGACAIIALLHDVLVVVGVFAILGWSPLHIQVDALFITALLTIVGFSVHDTIVVFDRIRENMQRRTTESFEQVVNASLVQTLARSLNTSLTVIFTLSALTLFGGSGSVHNFTLALLIGIISGTYSSIFNASMLLVMWDKGELSFNRSRRRELPSSSRREERELARARG